MSRAALTVIGQSLSSLSNLLVQIAFVWALPTSQFGWVVISLSVYYFAVAIGRAWIGDAAVSVSAEQDTGWRWMWRRSLALGGASAIASLVAAVVAGEGQSALFVLSAGFTFMVAQDALRYRCWAFGRPWRVIWLESIWLVAGAAAALGALMILDPDLKGAAIAAAWVTGGLISLAVGLVLGWHRTADQRSTTSVGARRAGRSYVVDQLPIAVLSQVLPIAIAVVAGTVATAEYRLAFLPFMAVESLLLGLRVRLLPGLHPGHRGEVGSPGRRKRATIIFGGAAVVGAGLTAVATIGPLGALLEGVSDLGGLVFVAAGVVVVRAIGRPSADYAAVRVGSRRMAAIRSRWTVMEFLAAVVLALPFGVAGALGGRVVLASLGTAAWLRVGADAERSVVTAAKEQEDLVG